MANSRNRYQRNSRPSQSREVDVAAPQDRRPKGSNRRPDGPIVVHAWGQDWELDVDVMDDIEVVEKMESGLLTTVMRTILGEDQYADWKELAAERSETGRITIQTATEFMQDLGKAARRLRN